MHRAVGQLLLVALLAEGVDRNIRASFDTGKATLVALLAEGVDRNSFSKSRSL